MGKDIMDLAHRIKVAVLAEVGENYDQMLESRVGAVDYVTQKIADDFISSDSDYWTRLEHQYAGMFMKSFLDNFDGTAAIDVLADSAIDTAYILVKKLKEKEERK